MTVPPLPRRRTHGVGDEIAAHLERLIATGELTPGARLPAERELAGSLAVSRGSVREALGQLESKSLVERVQGRGTVVCLPPAQVGELHAGLDETEKELADVAELRAVVEPRIAEFAALRATPSDLLQLEDLLARSHEGLVTAESVRLDVEFHSALARASQNPLLATVNTLACSWTPDVRRRSHLTRRARRISVEGHRAIAVAVRARDGEAARRAMAEHLDAVAALTRLATDGAPDDSAPHEGESRP
ncbi:MAG: GntR family transcriptional regulator, transcriptional repressor for pyruvate dehydrogenase complex [Actinomycetota bacterium]|nr:GntR family transcriptional regulator, transcriptional repressor for pyruvate dehydrogenase complex [Actinomycetota bacterium]